MSFYDDSLNEKIFNNVDQNAFDFIDAATRVNNDLTAITYFGREMSYKDVKDEIYRYANKLKSYGLEKGDTVSLLLPNVPEIIYYYYAAWLLGIKINPIDPRFNSAGILNSINLSNSKLLVAILDCYSAKVSPILDKLNVEDIVLLSPSDSMDKNISGLVAKGAYKYKEFLLNLKDKDFRLNKIKFNDAFIGKTKSEKIDSIYEDGLIASNLFTSGTTGTPKGAQLSHRAFNVKANQITYGVPNLNAGDTFLAIIPFFSGYGSFAGMHNCLHKSMNLIMIPKFSPSEVSDLICKYQASAAIGVPKYWEDFINNLEENKRKYNINSLSFLKIPVAGGDKINPEIIDNFNKLFADEGLDTKLIVGYGSTETGGPIATTVSDPNYSDNETSGILFPGVDYLIVDPETNEILPDGQEGELAICDPGMMTGYENEEDTKRITIHHDGKNYIKMGDLFQINEKGMLYFKGRTKRVMMRPDGHTVHSLPIEEAITLSPAVNNCCVVGLKKADNSSGTIPTAFIILNPGYEVSEELISDIDNLSLQHLSERNRALAYVFVDKLPYTLMGKVDYKSLEKLIIDDLDYHVVDDTFLKGKNKVLTMKKY